MRFPWPLGCRRRPLMTALLQVQASVPARSTLHRLIGRSLLSSDARL